MDSILAIDMRTNGDKTIVGTPQNYSFDFKVGGPEKAGLLEKITNPLNPLSHKINIVGKDGKITEARVSEKDAKRIAELQARGYSVSANPGMGGVQGSIVVNP